MGSQSSDMKGEASTHKAGNLGTMAPAESADFGVVGELGRFAATLRYDDIPPRVLDKARWQLANVLASLHAGVHAEAANAVLRAVRRFDEAGPCTVFPSGERMSVHAAITANAALAMALDYDDYLYMGHTGHSAVLASLALAGARGLL
jgi:2-methylcitrate dehydratase PrpD